MVVPPRDSSLAIVAPFSALLHPYGALCLSLSLLPCLQGPSAAPQVRPSPLLAPSCSQWALRPTINSGKTSTVAIFQAATRGAATGTAFDVSAAQA